MPDDLRSLKTHGKSIMIGLRVAAAAVAVLGWAASHDALSQTPSSSNYRSLAVCEEVEMGGRWFNTFGEGRCPPGSRRPAPQLGQRGGDVNAQTMRRMQGQVQALGDAQQGLLAAASAIGERYQAEANERAATYAYHAVEDADVIDRSLLFQQNDFAFPFIGNVISAAVGQPILTTIRGYYAPCFMPLIDMSNRSFIGSVTHQVLGGNLSCKLNAGDLAYMPLYINVVSPSTTLSMGQNLQRRNDTYEICYRTLGQNAVCIRNIDGDSVVETIGLVELTQTSNIVATFGGVTENHLEIRVGESKDRAGRILRFDLSSSRMIEIQGVTFEVLEFTDDEIIMQRRQ